MTGLRAPRERQQRGAAPMRVRAVKMTDEEWDLAQELATAEGCTRGSLVRRALREYAEKRASPPAKRSRRSA